MRVDPVKLIQFIVRQATEFVLPAGTFLSYLGNLLRIALLLSPTINQNARSCLGRVERGTKREIGGSVQDSKLNLDELLRGFRVYIT
jgi:hypothetical protein